MTVDPDLDLNHRLPDGRRITYRLYGDPDGVPVIALHGTPGSRLKFAIAHRAAAELGLLLISPDRWGYGGTDAPAEPALTDYPGDIVDLADALGAERFAVVGISGGGPFSVALAARLSERVCALALVAPVGPIEADPVESTGEYASASPNIAPFHRFCFKLLPRIPGGVTTTFGVFRSLLRSAPDFAIRLAAARACRLDREILSEPAARARLAQTFRLGLDTGTTGPGIDMRLFSQSWRLDLGRLTMPGRLWLGTADRNVPQASARFLAQRAPGLAFTPVDDAGHFWISQHYVEVLKWLAAASGECAAKRTIARSPREKAT